MIKLHLACGPTRLEGYRNIDIVPTEATDEVGDLRTLDFPPGSVSEIVIFQTLQFFTYDELREVLRSFHRWLGPGGRIVLSIPNFNKIVLRYPKYAYNFSERLGGDIIGFDRWPHRSLFTPRFFKTFTSELGFRARTIGNRGFRGSRPHWTMTSFELVRQGD